MTKFFTFLAVLLLATNVYSADSATSNAISQEDAGWLGVTQGLTEYLPISSTAHLILVDDFMSQKNEIDENVQSAKNSYFAIIQVGSVLAVILLYWRRMTSILHGFLDKDDNGRRLGINLMISFLPSVIVGLMLDGWLQKKLYNKTAIAISLIVGALIMCIVEWKFSNNHNISKAHKTIDKLTICDAIKIGIWQCLALIPGMSRSMTTIAGGYTCNLKREQSAEYSFLLGAITLAAACVYKLAKDFDTIFCCFSTSTFLVGISIAFIASIIAIRLMIPFISRHGLLPFAIYRIVLGGIIFYGILR